MSISAQEMASRLREVPEGSTVFVSYVAGREPTDRAIEEARPYTQNQSRRHFVGEFRGVWMTKKGERVMTIFAHNRDTIRGATRSHGGYRTFNPSLGELLTIEVLH